MTLERIHEILGHAKVTQARELIDLIKVEPDEMGMPPVTRGGNRLRPDLLAFLILGNNQLAGILLNQGQILQLHEIANQAKANAESILDTNITERRISESVWDYCCEDDEDEEGEEDRPDNDPNF